MVVTSVSKNLLWVPPPGDPPIEYVESIMMIFKQLFLLYFHYSIFIYMDLTSQNRHLIIIIIIIHPVWIAQHSRYHEEFTYLP